MKIYYLAIHASNSFDEPIYFVLHAPTDIEACQLAIESLGLEPEDYDVDDQILLSTKRLPIAEQALNSDSFFVWQFLPEVDSTAPKALKLKLVS